MYIKGFGLNSPGLLFSSRKFGIELDSIDSTSISILTRKDFVSAVDIHGGNIQNINCLYNTALKCHNSDNLCELVAKCGIHQSANPQIVSCFCNDNFNILKCI